MVFLVISVLPILKFVQTQTKNSALNIHTDEAVFYKARLQRIFETISSGLANDNLNNPKVQKFFSSIKIKCQEKEYL